MSADLFGALYVMQVGRGRLCGGCGGDGGGDLADVCPVSCYGSLRKPRFNSYMVCLGYGWHSASVMHTPDASPHAQVADLAG